MEFFTGFALWGSGVVVGAGTMYFFYSSLADVQRHERKKAKREMESAYRYNQAMRTELNARTNDLRAMQEREGRASSWLEGYETGVRAAMQETAENRATGRYRRAVNR